MFFVGISEHTLDAKGRLFIPAEFREYFGSEFYIFQSPDGCICIYDTATFTELTEKVRKSAVDQATRAKQRKFFATSKKVAMDKQGRFTLPQSYIDFASLGNEVVILGEVNRLEVWRKDAPEIIDAMTPSYSADDYPDVPY